MKLSLGELESRLKAEGHLREANLDKSNLKGLRQPGADLSKASLKGANLSKGDLSGANLSFADLSGANLKGTNLAGANLEGARLEKAALDECDLTGARLDRAVLIGATARKATFGGGTSDGADFSGADLANAKVVGGGFTNCKFTEAALAGGEWTEARLVGCDFGKANLQDATLPKLDAEGCSFQGAVLSFAAITDARFAACSFVGAEIYAATLNNVRFEGADLSGANFQSAELRGVALGFTSVKKANFKSVSGLDDAALQDLKAQGAAISRGLVKRLGLFVWRSTAAKVIVVALIAATAYGAYRYRANPVNWGFEQLMTAAQKARNGGQLDAAKKYLDIALQKYKTTYRESQILFMKADLAGETGDYAEAERLFRLVISDYPDNEDTIFNSNVRIAELFNKQGKTDEAIQQARKIIKDWEFYYGVGNAYRLLADVYMDRGDKDQAVAAIQEFIQKHADDKKFVAEGNRLLAELYQRAGMTDEALKLYLAMLQESTPDENPQWIYNRVGDIYFNQGKLEDAERIYKTLTGKFPQNGDVQIIALSGLARIAERKNDLEGAEKLLRDALTRYPKSDAVPGLMSTLANLYQEMGKTDEARAIYDKMISRFGNRQGDVTQAYFGHQLRPRPAGHSIGAPGRGVEDL